MPKLTLTPKEYNEFQQKLARYSATISSDLTNAESTAALFDFLQHKPVTIVVEKETANERLSDTINANG
jgi:hypothetical protein